MSSPPPLVPGEVFPLGAHPVPGGTRFAVASATATRVQVCLVDPDGPGGPVERRVDLVESDHGVWHGPFIEWIKSVVLVVHH